MTYRFLPHPDAERFDAVTIETVERWKESELSGDEWRFSHVVVFWFHGRRVARAGAGSIREACLVAVHRYARVEVGDTYRSIEAEVCCQPGCPSPWRYLLHPIKRYTRGGDELARPYRVGEVRGFCQKHRHRGDCGLDDADDNYVQVADRSDLHAEFCAWWLDGAVCDCPAGEPEATTAAAADLVGDA